MSSPLKLFVLRRRYFSIWRALKPQFSTSNSLQNPFLFSVSKPLVEYSNSGIETLLFSPYNRYFRSFCSRSGEEFQGPTAIDYRSLLQEDEYQKLADSTIQDLLEKLEEYGDSVDIDGFDIDYGNEVLTVTLGNLGTYVINKQTPNRQIWMSSPVSGPSRFNWDRNAQAWIYRRTKAKLLEVLERELEELCGQPIDLS